MCYICIRWWEQPYLCLRIFFITFLCSRWIKHGGHNSVSFWGLSNLAWSTTSPVSLFWWGTSAGTYFIFVISKDSITLRIERRAHFFLGLVILTTATTFLEREKFRAKGGARLKGMRGNPNKSQEPPCRNPVLWYMCLKLSMKAQEL